MSSVQMTYASSITGSTRTCFLLMGALLLMTILFLSESALARDEHSLVGEKVKKDFAVGFCDIGSMTVKYHIDTLEGKPTVRGSYAWESAYGTPANCLDEDLVIWLKLRSGNATGYIRLAPQVPKAGEGFSKPFISKIKWKNFICSYKGTEKQSCFPSRIARKMFTEGEVIGFVLSQR